MTLLGYKSKSLCLLGLLKRFSTSFLILLLVMIGSMQIMSQTTFANRQIQKTESEQPNIVELKKDFLEREITGKQQHIYSVNLDHGQFFFLNVQQLGTDVAIQLFDIDGSMLVETNTPDLLLGSEPLYWIVEQTGIYRIVIKTTDPTATSGKYSIMYEVREKKPLDFHYVEAQKYLAEAQKLSHQGGRRNLEKSITYYNEAAKHWNKVGQVEREAVCINLLGSSTYYLNDVKGALNYYQQALQLALEPALKVDILTNAGIMNDTLGDKRKAIEYLEEALGVSEKISNKGIANILNSLGLLYSDSANQEKALFFFSQALTASRNVGNRTDEAVTLHNIALTFTKNSNYDKAIIFSKEALIIWEEIGDLHNRVFTLNQMGNIYLGIYDLEMALDFYQKAVDLTKGTGENQETGQSQERGVALRQMGHIWYLKKDYEKALNYLQQALDIETKSKDKVSESYSLVNRGMVYSALGDQNKALQDYINAYDIAKAIGNKKLEADIVYKKALAQQKLGNVDSAIEQVKIAIELSEFFRANSSNQQLKTFHFSTTNRYYKLYIDLLMQLHQQDPSKNYNAQALYIHELSHARTLLELLQEANINIREGITTDLIDKEKQLIHAINKNTESLLRLLSKPNYSVEDKNKLEKQINELELELQQLQSKIREANPRYATIQKPKILSLEEIQKEILDDDTILLEYSLGKDASYLWLVTNKSFSSYKLPSKEEIEKAVDPVLTYYRTFFHPQTESELDKKRNAAKEELFIKATNKFSQMILGQVASQLGNKRLLVVPDGVLQYVPFNGLPDPRSKIVGNKEFPPLVVEHEVVIMPSASTMGVLRNQFVGRKRAPKSIMVLADPAFNVTDERLAVNSKKTLSTAKASDKAEQNNEISVARSGLNRTDLVRLIASSEEAINIKQIYPDANVALGTKANLFLATSSEVSDYRILHFSTHGFIHPLQPELSGLVLSLFNDDGKEQNGYLTANHIFNLKINADLVVLSACQTGLGREINGEGILGLSRGFMYAGAERIVFSLWNVNDKSTTALMTKFYSAMKEGLTPSAALRQAQISMQKDKKWSSPYYWAGFQIQGEWLKN